MKKTYSIPTVRIVIISDDDLIATSTLRNSVTGYSFRDSFYSDDEDAYEGDGL